MISYLGTVATAFSVLANALLGGRRCETMSYRAARAQRAQRRWGCVLCKILDAVDDKHCQKALDWRKEGR